MQLTQFLSGLCARAIIGGASLALFGLPASVKANLIITELNYNASLADGLTEFVEIKNVGEETIGVTGYTIDGVGVTTWTNAMIAPGGFLVVAENRTAFQAKYGVPPDGTFDRGLSGRGERVDLLDATGEELFSVRYWDGGTPFDATEEGRDEWPSSPDGDGYTLVPMDPNRNQDPDDYTNWRPSIALGGSPGADEPLPNPVPSILVNEVRTRDGILVNDAVELHNPGTTPVAVSSWFLTDTINNPKKIPLPPSSIVPAGGYLVIENGVDGVALSLSSKGERVFIYSADSSGQLTGYVDGVHFGASGDGLTFSRMTNADGVVQFAPTMPSLGQVNHAPKVGPVVITEFLYNATAEGDEFVEIQNISNQSVALYDPAYPAVNWRVEGISFTLNGTQPSLAAGEIAVISPIDPSVFRAKHHVPDGIQIFGPYAIGLDPPVLRNGGELLALQRPESVDLEQVYIDEDSVEYDNRDPWPRKAGSESRSLERVIAGSYGDESINWKNGLLGGTPGYMTNVYAGPDIHVNEILAHTDLPQVDAIELFNPSGTPVEIGGWWLSDSQGNPRKFQIPTGATVPPLGYWAINADNDDTAGAPAGYFGSAFLLSENGERVVLSSADADGRLTGYQTSERFPGTDSGVSIGRVVDSQMRSALVPMGLVTIETNRFVANPAGSQNSDPKIGPVVISELLYDPMGIDREFIELSNITSTPVALYDVGNPANTWLFNSGVTFSFPGPMPTIPANGKVVILPAGADITLFRDTHNIPADVTIYGGVDGYTGSLNNGGEKLVLSKRGAPNVDEGGMVPEILVDYLDYEGGAPWPDLPSGSGRSIERIEPGLYGSEAQNWKASNAIGGSPGTVNSQGTVYEVWQYSMFTATEIATGTTSSGEDFNRDGISNLLAYAYGLDPRQEASPTDLADGRLINLPAAQFAAVQFRRNMAPVDLNIEVKASKDLVVWDGVTTQFGYGADNGDGSETVTMRTVEPFESDPRIFMKIFVSFSSP